MEGDFIKINNRLLPLSWLYGLGVKFRNFLFDTGVLRSRAYNIPVIAVGNITVGGTGKTPHVEYLVRLLKDLANVAVLSRGYKRRSRGFVLATEDTPMRTIGDEPYQMKQKFPEVTVAVDKKRTRGIDRLIRLDDKPIDVILLDDAFQHRYVTPGINILLVDYHRLVIYDKLLPAGRLREPLNGKNRADIVIVTKCPEDLKPMDYRVITKAMNLYPYQQLFFTGLQYDSLQPVFNRGQQATRPLTQLRKTNVLLLTGIASPKQIMVDLKPHVASIIPLTYGDHHRFSRKDIERINSEYESLTPPRLVITTEKDAARLSEATGLTDEVRQNLFALPVRTVFRLEQENMFNENIIGYVRKNSRNSILAKSKDDNQSKDSHHPGDRPRTISF